METQPANQQFIELVDQHKGIVYKIARSYCTHADDREDLAQEIIFQLWRSFPQFNPEYRFSTWMYRIALNVAISFYRKARRVVHVPLDGLLFEFADKPTADDSNFHLLQQFIDELPPLDKGLMLLYLDERSHQEIAEIIGISTSNVGTRVGRIKIQLKSKFLNHGT